MVLSGLANKALAAGLTAAGVVAAGISCRDAGLVTARLEPDLGRVGLPETVRPALVQALWAAGIVPVVSPVASTEDGASVNVNADEAALGLARSLGASSLVYLSDVDGVRIGEAAVSSLTAREAEATHRRRHHRRGHGPQGARRPRGRAQHSASRHRRPGPSRRTVRRHHHHRRGGPIMSSALLHVYDRDLVLVRGKGARLFDRDGNVYRRLRRRHRRQRTRLRGREGGSRHQEAGVAADPREQPLPHRTCNGARRTSGVPRLPVQGLPLQLGHRGLGRRR